MGAQREHMVASRGRNGPVVALSRLQLFCKNETSAETFYSGKMGKLSKR